MPQDQNATPPTSSGNRRYSIAGQSPRLPVLTREELLRPGATGNRTELAPSNPRCATERTGGPTGTTEH
ncbi:hypothetical protein ACWEO1_16795 [Kitasatospora cineracea]